MIISPSIVIGVGYTGKRISEALKNSIQHRYDDFPLIEVILYPDLDASNPKKDSNKKSTSALNEKRVNQRLKERERFKTSHLSFSERFDIAAARINSVEADKQFRKLAEEDHINISKSGSINIYIVGGFSEPVCSGVLVDISYFCRYLLQTKHDMGGISINGLFIIPPVLPQDSLNSNEGLTNEALLYATLKELDYFSEVKNFSLDYITPRFSFTDEKPFNFCYPLDTIRNNQVTLSNSEDLIPISGEILFHLIFPPIGERLSNPVTSEVLSEYFYHEEKVKAYSGIGLASIGFPAKEMLKAATFRYGSEIIHHGLLLPEPDKSEVEKEIKNFREANELEDKCFLEEVLNVIRGEVGRETDLILFENIPWYSNHNLEFLKDRIDQLKKKTKEEWRNSVEKEGREKIKKIREYLDARKAELLHCRRKDRDDKSIHFACDFLKGLKEKIIQRAAVFKQKIKDHEKESQRLDRAQEVNRGILSDLYKCIPGKWKILLGGGLILLFSIFISYLAYKLYPIKWSIAVPILFFLELCLAYFVWRRIRGDIEELRYKILGENIGQWFKIQIEEFTYTIDQEFIDEEFAPYLDLQIEKLEHFVKNLEEIKEEFKKQEEDLSAKLSGYKRFLTDECILDWEEVLHRYHEDREKLGKPDSGNRNPRQPDDSETVEKWLDETREWIKAKIITTARDKVNSSDLAQLKVEDILRKKGIESDTLTSRLKQMVEDSSPLIRFGSMQLPTEFVQSSTIVGYFTGSDKQIQESLSKFNCEYESISTRRRDQFLVVSYCHGIPLCDLNRIKFYKRKYYAIPQEQRTSLHAFENLEKDDYDVLPYIRTAEELEVEQLCGIAVCLGIIYKKRTEAGEKIETPFLFENEKAIAIEGYIPPGSKLPFSLQPILSTGGALNGLKHEIDEKLENSEPEKLIEMLQQGLAEYQLTPIMRKEVESYLEKMGVK